MKTFILFALTALFMLSQNVFAACGTAAHRQQIDIRNVNGTIQILDKEKTEKCVVLNNLSIDEITGSSVTWVFHNLNCADGQCNVKLAGFNDSASLIKCKGNKDHYTCRMHVNKLTKACRQVGRIHEGSCEVNYDVEVRGEIIDPIIVIKPLPTEPD